MDSIILRTGENAHLTQPKRLRAPWEREQQERKEVFMLEWLNDLIRLSLKLTTSPRL